MAFEAAELVKEDGLAYLLRDLATRPATTDIPAPRQR